MTIFQRCNVTAPLICPLLIGSFLLGKVAKEVYKLIMSFEDSERSLKMNSGAFYIPKKNKLNPQGEDANFIYAEEQTIGVADGVGGWAAYGIDAGEYARDLMINSVIAIQNRTKSAVNPKQVLKEAYLNTNAEGSSTACIITLVGDCLHGANVGDSGFMVFRDGEIIFRSPEQQHGFNIPFQLGITSGCDQPSSAKELRVVVKSGDVVVAGTDGLFDNMHALDIMNVVNQGQEEGVEPQQLAWRIAELALYNSHDKFADTPFSRAAREAGFLHMGGKVDDITVIIAYIV